MKFRAKVIPSGNATAVEVPTEVMAALGAEARPPVTITINGTTWRSRIALMRGKVLIGISAANRQAAGIAEGDEIELDVTLDTAPRTVEEPEDLAAALDAAPTARTSFDKLAFGLKGKHIRDIEAAKSDEVRARRIAKLVETLSSP
jgi:antitoxin component of MazEF toxin-antitoxin module